MKSIRTLGAVVLAGALVLGSAGVANAAGTRSGTIGCGSNNQRASIRSMASGTVIHYYAAAGKSYRFANGGAYRSNTSIHPTLRNTAWKVSTNGGIDSAVGYCTTTGV